MRGDVLNIAVTRDVESIADAYGDYIPFGLEVRFAEVRYSKRELDELMQRIVPDTWVDGPAPVGVWPHPDEPLGVTFVGVDPVRNGLVVGIHPFGDEAVGELDRRYGPMIEVIHRELQRLL